MPRPRRLVQQTLETYIPISGAMQSYIFDTIAGVVHTRGEAGAVAFLSGCIIIFGACLCAVQAEARSTPAATLGAR